VKALIIPPFLLALQTVAGSAAPPPPVVVMSPEDERKFLDALPLVEIEGRGFRIFAIQGVGDRAILEQAAQKLKSEGWDCSVAVDQTGTLQLAVFAKDRTLQDIQRLASRFSVREFGAIEAKPMLFPDSRGS
jgi:hypothetical protein